MDTSKAAIKQRITEIVTSKQGLKATELAVEMFMYGDVWIDVMVEMIRANELVEVEYSLPTLNYRLKSFLLPVETVVGINGWKP